MDELSLYPVRKVEIIVQGDRLKTLETVLDELGVTGYTIVRDVAGKGHHGVHGGRLIFNERDSYAMLVTVLSSDKFEALAQRIKPLLEDSSGVLFVSEVSVLRMNYF